MPQMSMQIYVFSEAGDGSCYYNNFHTPTFGVRYRYASYDNGAITDKDCLDDGTCFRVRFLNHNVNYRSNVSKTINKICFSLFCVISVNLF